MVFLVANVVRVGVVLAGVDIPGVPFPVVVVSAVAVLGVVGFGVVAVIISGPFIQQFDLSCKRRESPPWILYGRILYRCSVVVARGIF
jgi:hypothetical protein